MMVPLLLKLPMADPEPIVPVGSDAQLITAALIGFVVIIALITWLKVHPFLALTIGALGVGIGAGMATGQALTSFSTGFGSTMGGVGAMFGKLLADSGGADRIVDTLIARSNPRMLPWTMGVVGAVIGLPMFFEIGLVLLIPVIILVARRSGVPLMKIAIPTLAGLSAMHGLVPPHPGPLIAIDALGANLGLTLAFGVIVAIPAVIISGPVFSKFAAKWAPVGVPDMFLTAEDTGEDAPARTRPSFFAALSSVLLPVMLMMAKAVVAVITPESTAPWKLFIDFIGTPTIALLITLIFGIFVLGVGGGMNRSAIAKSLESSLGPIAGILLIVGAGGAFKQVLIDTGIGEVITRAVLESGISVLLLGWIVAVLVRVATGSATIATITAAGLMTSVTSTLPGPEVALLVLAIGSGSVFLSHVNDAGFWLVKQYLGTNLPQTFKTWTVMECLISVTGLVGVLLLDLVV
jgi:GntP family gluconate:H+ symporter